MKTDKTNDPKLADGFHRAPTTLSTGESSKSARPTQDQGSTDGHIKVTDLPFSGSEKGRTFFVSSDEVRMPDSHPLKFSSEALPKAPEPHLSREGRQRSSQQATRMTELFLPIEGGLTLEDWMKERPDSGPATPLQENKHNSTLPDNSKPALLPSKPPPRGLRAAERPYHFKTADFTPIDIGEQKDAPDQDSAAAATASQDYPIDLDKLDLGDIRPRRDTHSGFGNTPTDIDNSSAAQVPTQTVPPPTAPPSPAHGARSSEGFAEGCMTDLDELMKGYE